jgi:hypothetical protein
MRFACVLALVACSCKGSESQSFAEAMAVVCDGAGKDPTYLHDKLRNPEVIRFFAALGDLNPAERQQRFAAALKRAGLTTCAAFPNRAEAGTPIPTVPDVGLVELGTDPSVVITTHGIVVDGKTILAVTNGDVDAAEKEGGSMGIKIPRLTNYMTALGEEMKAHGGPPTSVMLLVDPTTPYKLLIEVMYSVKSVTMRDFVLAVHAGSALKGIPIVLPDKAASGQQHGLGMVVVIANDHLTLWSTSGEEGTLQKPKLEVAIDRATDIEKALAEIVARRWPDGKRVSDREIIVMADGGIAMQRIADVVARARVALDGKELFPDVRLSSGFE